MSRIGTFRVLVTGSRDWEDQLAVEIALMDAAVECHRMGTPDLVIVHGACPSGADAYAAEFAEWARGRGKDIRITEERHPADWRTYGRAAGPRRNAEMVSVGADLCVAFIRNGSKGATHCAELAEKAGIPTRRYEARKECTA